MGLHLLGGAGGGGGTGQDGEQGPPGLVWQGAYNSGTTYAINDAVSYQGRAFIALAGTTGVAPPTTATSNATWSLVADKGADGAAGASGLSSSLGPLTTGEETMSRFLARDNNVPLNSGAMALTYFTATKTETITKLITGVGNAGSGGTKSRMGVYAVNRATGALTSLLASTPAATTDRWNVSFQNPNSSGINNVGTLSSSWSKVAGTDYAIGLLFVGTTAPNIIGGLLLAGGGDAGLAPRLSGLVTGQTDLPASVAAGSVASFGYAPYVNMIP